MDKEYVKKLVIARLRAMPPDVSFSIGSHGDFTRNDLIKQVMSDTPVGKAATEMELTFLKKMTKISEML